MTARTFDNMGKNHGKYDMDRIGLFSEMPYMIGDKYQQPIMSLYNHNFFRYIIFKYLFYKILIYDL